jgi:hypothetical protein
MIAAIRTTDKRHASPGFILTQGLHFISETDKTLYQNMVSLQKTNAVQI